LIGSTIGQRRPIPLTALGKALLAYSAPSLLDRVAAAGWERRTENSLRSVPALERQLAEIRRFGFAIDNEECDVGLRCAATPIFSHAGLPIAAISATTLTSRVDHDALTLLAAELAKAAQEVSAALGWSQGETAPTT
jgi:DNA-binding IclR family transcriptional regulator